MKTKKSIIAYYIIIIIGLVLLLGSIIIDTGFLSGKTIEKNNGLIWGLTIISKVLSTVGLALAISGITSRVRKGELIESVLNSNDKENMIITLLERKTDLDEYLKLKINELYNIENRYFTNYTINAAVSQKDDAIVATTEVSYIDNGRTKADKKISAFFDKKEDYVDKLVIINPQKREQYKEFCNDPDNGIEEIPSQVNQEYGVYENEFFIMLPKEFLVLDRLEIQKNYTTFGSDHWIEIGTIFARPTHNVTINVTIEDGLIIKDVFITGNSKMYNIKKTPTSYLFKNPEWISSYCGICILVAKNKTSEEKNE